MEEVTRPSKGKLIWQTLVLFAMLIGLPAVSWWYLKGGLDYRLEAMDEIKPLGAMEALPFPTIDGVSPAVAGNILLISYLQESQIEIAGTRLDKIHQQFTERPDFLMLQMAAQDSTTLQQWLQTYQLDDAQQCYWFSAPEESLLPYFKQGLKTTDLSPGESFAVLVDTSGMVRRQYQLMDETQVRRLIEHIALILPREKEKELVFKRQTEK